MAKRMGATEASRPVPAPVVIGGIGFSGTRVVARIARASGLFMGVELNESEDSLCFFDFAERWAHVAHRAWASGDPLREAGPLAMDLEAAVARHRRPISGTSRIWGWKQPRSLHFLPFLDRRFPALRYIHVIRDGLDLAAGPEVAARLEVGREGTGAYSAARGMLDELGRDPPRIQMVRFWSRANLLAADYGEAEMGLRYLRIRLEDLCSAPQAVTAEILRFVLGAEPPAELVTTAARQVHRPDSLGRPRDPGFARSGTDIAKEALLRFGYLAGAQTGE